MNNLAGQLAPYTQEGEEALLGSCMVDPVMFKMVNGLVDGDDFYILRHGYIWSALLHLEANKLQIDYVSIIEALRTLGHLNDIGGPGYLLSLINATPTSQHAITYAELVRRTAVRRRGLAAADEMKALFMDETIDSDDVLAKVDRKWASVRDGGLRRRDIPIAETMDLVMAGIEERMRDPSKSIGFLTGWTAFDELTSGFIKGEVSIFCGRPGMGKTAIILNIILILAKLGLRIGILSLEMPREDLILRLAAIESGLDIHLIREGKITSDEYQRLVRAKNIVRSLPIWIEDDPNVTPIQLLSIASRWQFGVGLDMLFVDYLQLMSGGRFQENQRSAEVAFISRSIKVMARGLNIPVALGAQLNRDLEKRDNKRPQLSDLRESGAIENDADLVHGLYRDYEYNQKTEHPNALEVLTLKHRNGSKGRTFLHFQKESNKITSAKVTTHDLSLLGVPAAARKTLPPPKNNNHRRAAAAKEADTESDHDDD